MHGSTACDSYAIQGSSNLIHNPKIKIDECTITISQFKTNTPKYKTIANKLLLMITNIDTH
jgi:hypothetical protein